MCGRATLTTPIEEIAEEFGVAPLPIGPPRYNIAPGQPLVVVRGSELSLLKWGLPGEKRPIIQMRAEGVGKTPRLGQRCLVVVDGFYEWSSPPEGKRQPHHVHMRKGGPFSLAGLWEDDGCAVLTTHARGAIAEIHGRMPLVVAPGDRKAWLAGSLDEARDLLWKKTEPDVAIVPVSMRVNDVKNDDAGCLESPAPRVEGQIKLAFE
jgi:putative SOS response-associated peptidase YedK